MNETSCGHNFQFNFITAKDLLREERIRLLPEGGWEFYPGNRFTITVPRGAVFSTNGSGLITMTGCKIQIEGLEGEESLQKLPPTQPISRIQELERELATYRAWLKYDIDELGRPEEAAKRIAELEKALRDATEGAGPTH